MDENGMKFSETQIDDLTKAMFDDADPDNRGGLQKIYFHIFLTNSSHIKTFQQSHMKV